MMNLILTDFYPPMINHFLSI